MKSELSFYSVVLGDKDDVIYGQKIGRKTLKLDPFEKVVLRCLLHQQSCTRKVDLQKLFPQRCVPNVEAKTVVAKLEARYRNSKLKS